MYPKVSSENAPTPASRAVVSASLIMGRSFLAQRRDDFLEVFAAPERRSSIQFQTERGRHVGYTVRAGKLGVSDRERRALSPA